MCILCLDARISMHKHAYVQTYMYTYIYELMHIGVKVPIKHLN